MAAHDQKYDGPTNNPNIYRIEGIVEACRGKSVLHLGFIQHADVYREKIAQGKWLHGQLAEVTTHLVGLDYLAKEVEDIKRDYGFDCMYGDVTRLEEVPVSDTFDIILCGELIEHLDNFGLMLDGLKRFMHKDSVLLITTPNIWSELRIKLIKQGVDEWSWMNKEHTCAFTYQTLKQTLERHGYVEHKYWYTYAETMKEIIKTGSAMDSVKNFVKGMILHRTPYRLWDGLFFVAKRGS